MGTSLKDLKKFPKEVKEEMGYSLFVAQLGEKHDKAKALIEEKGRNSEERP